MIESLFDMINCNISKNKDINFQQLDIDAF